MAEPPASELLRASLFGYRQAPVWHVTATMLIPDSWDGTTQPEPPDIRGAYAVGRAGDVEWCGWSHRADLVPAIVVQSGTAFVRGRMAVYAFEDPPTLSRLEKVVGDAWVRTSLATARANGWTSAVDHVDRSLDFVTDDALASARHVGTDTTNGEIAVHCADRDWHIDPTTLDWRTDRIHELADVRLSYSPPMPAVAPPRGTEALDAGALAGPLGLHRVPRKATPESPDISPPEDDDTAWSVTSYDLADLLDVDHCVAAQERVREALTQSHRALLARVEFDSEGSMFAAYCRTRADAIQLRKVIDGLVASHRS